MKGYMVTHTRRSERNRLASHLAATVSYLWIKALVGVVAGAVVSSGVLAGTRTATAARAVSRAAAAGAAARAPLRGASLQHA